MLGYGAADLAAVSSCQVIAEILAGLPGTQSAGATRGNRH